MNEKKKTIIVLSIIGVILLLIVAFLFKGDEYSEKIYTQFEQAFYGEENKLIYIGRPTCTYCALLDPSIKDMEERYDIEYIYIDTDEFASSYRNKVMNLLGLSEITTPYLAVVSNGKLVDSKKGNGEYSDYFLFLQKNNIIDKEAELSLNYIDFEGYEELLESKKNNIIVIGQTNCMYCVKAKIRLNNIADEHGITINYLNINKLSKDEGAAFEQSLKYFQEEEWGTPIMMIVKNGKIVDMIEQLVTEEEYVEFLERNELL